jgi:hypothetical protein
MSCGGGGFGRGAVTFFDDFCRLPLVEKLDEGAFTMAGGLPKKILIFPNFCESGGRTMQIGSISSVAAMEAASAVSPTAQTAGASSGSSASGSKSEAQGVMSPEQEALAAVYTTSVAGHDYLGTVQQAAGEYVASVADPPAPPITGIGSSIALAENNLTVTIDERV